MFGRNKRIIKLEARIAEVQQELTNLKNQLGEDCLIDYMRLTKASMDGWMTSRFHKANPVAKKIDMLMDHLGLELQTVEARKSM